jgi:hypothetical protein
VRFRSIVLWTAVAAFFGAPAGAQTATKNELTVLAGISLIGASAKDNGISILLGRAPEIGLIYPPFFGVTRSLDASGHLGVRYGRSITDAVGLEGDVVIAPAHQLEQRTSYGCPEPLVCIASPATAIIAPDYRFQQRVVAYHYGGNMRLRFPPGPLEPSIIAGIGAVTYAGEGYHRSHFAVRAGGAVGASVGSLRASIEVVDVIVADHFVTSRTEHDVHVRVGVGVKW